LHFQISILFRRAVLFPLSLTHISAYPRISCTGAVAEDDSTTRTLPLPTTPEAAATMHEGGCLKACGRVRVTGVMAVKVPVAFLVVPPCVHSTSQPTTTLCRGLVVTVTVIVIGWLAVPPVAQFALSPLAAHDATVPALAATALPVTAAAVSNPVAARQAERRENFFMTNYPFRQAPVNKTRGSASGFTREGHEMGIASGRPGPGRSGLAPLQAAGT
jgi:hypothetical protein